MIGKMIAPGVLSLVMLLIGPNDSFSQQLSGVQVKQIAQSLVEQRILTPQGKDELIRYAEKKPLKIYANFSVSFLDEVNCSVYFLEEFKDILPGRENLSSQYLDSIANKNPEKKNLVQEEKYLAQNFPSRSHLFNFLYTTILFYHYNKAREGTDSTNRLITGFREYLGEEIVKLNGDTTIGFNVSSDDDTKALQQKRVEQVKPFMKWVKLFKDVGLLDATDGRIESRYTQGERIISPVSNLEMLKLIKELIVYHDKFPYYRQQQTYLVDSLAGIGFIDPVAKNNLIRLNKVDTLLTIDDFVVQTKNCIALDRATEIEPNDFITRNEYGKIPIARIKNLYENVLKKASDLLHFNYSDLQIHTIEDNEGQFQLLKSPENRQFYIYIRINGTLYKELLKEKDLQSWVSAENFQFLNHFLEDQNDDRRFYFSSGSLFTGYEPQEPKTVFLTLLKEKEADLFKNKYLASELNACYNGSPGDYSYAVWAPYDQRERMRRSQIVDFVELCSKANMITNLDLAKQEGLIAAIREKNPSTISNILLELPNAFMYEEGQTVEGFLNKVESKVQYLQNTKVPLYTDYLESVMTTEGTGEEQGSFAYRFYCGSKKYELTVTKESDLWKDNRLLETLNKAMQGADIPYKICPLSINDLSAPQDLYGKCYILLSAKQVNAIERKYGKVFN